MTLGFLAAGRISLKESVFYIISQLIGAISASFLLGFIFPEARTLGETLPGFNWISAFIFEILLSFILMFIVLNISTGHKEKGIIAGVTVGGTITMEALIDGPISGASMNPARSLGPALVALNLEHIWIYLAAPILGTLLAAPTCLLMQG